MNYRNRLTACLLALLLLWCIPATAWAEEAPPEDGILEETSLSPQEDPSSEEGEKTPSELLESQETAYNDGPLLIMGGHDTYLNGYPGALFKPEKGMTRAEVAQMLYNLLTTKPETSESKFSDVPTSQWYAVAVNALAGANVISGYSDGTFLPNKVITRAEFVSLLVRCFSLEQGTATFPDTANHWAAADISAAASAGWVHGTDTGVFQPNRGIKRSEVVTVMNAALNRKGDGYAADRNTQKFVDVPSTYWGYLDITEAAKPDQTIQPPAPSDSFTVGGSAMVMADALNMRSAPSTGSDVVTVLRQGTVVTVTDVSSLSSSWLGVKTSTGKTGFAYTGTDSDPYLVPYTPGQTAGATLSASSLSLCQYQSARLDGSVSAGDFRHMTWSSSDASVAVAAYTVPYNNSANDNDEILSGCAILYGKKPGTTVITFSDAAGKAVAKCTVTVTAAEPVRFAYAEDNSAVKGKATNLVAITDATHPSIVFRVTGGPQAGNYTTNLFTTESRNSQHGLPTNTVRIFKKSITFTQAGTYTVQAGFGTQAVKEFTVFVRDGDQSATTTANGERRTSTECLKIIANFEGAVPEIEDDRISNGNPTVGHGLVVQKNKAFYNCMTTTEMYAQLVTTVNNSGYAAAVNRFLSRYNMKMSQAQFDALVSLVYNCGATPLGEDKGVAMAMINAVVPPQNLSAGNPRSGVLNVDGSRVYKEASLSSAALGVLNLNSAVKVIGSRVNTDKKEVWYQISYGSGSGWIPAGLVKLSGSDLTHDMAYADSITVANNMLQWNKSNRKVYEGLVLRRMAEAKVFFYGNYAEAYHSHANYKKNTYGFVFPDDCKAFDYR